MIGFKIGAFLVGALSFALVVVLAEGEGRAEAGAGTVTITLSKAQVAQVARARGAKATITLSTGQMRLVKAAFPGFRGAGVVQASCSPSKSGGAPTPAKVTAVLRVVNGRLEVLTQGRGYAWTCETAADGSR